MWRISGFYEINAFGGAFLGDPQIVTVPGGGTVTENLFVPYRGPAALKGRVQVTGLPPGVTLYEISVLLCPSFAPYNGVSPSIACVTGYSSQIDQSTESGPFQVSGLPPGKWTAYPGYCTEFGCATNAKAGKQVNLVSGRTRTVALSTPFIVPPFGLLTGTISLKGAPGGFSPPLGVSACQSGTNNCQTVPVYAGNGYTVLLSDGQWTVQGLYLVPPFYNAIVGPKQNVTIPGGQVTTLDLTVPYQVLGTVAGMVHVTGVPHGVSITAYTVLACPAFSPWTGGPPSIECVNEYSGPGGLLFGGANAARINALAHPPASRLNSQPRPNQYQLPTLTPGDWLLYPGYQTVFGSYTDPSGTRVTVVGGKTLSRRLTVPYQAPSVGAVVGRVLVIGAPANGFQAGTKACSTPDMTTCSNEHEAYDNSLGSYQLPLAPGTWWVSGFVDVYAVFSGSNTTVTPPREVTVTAGTQTRADFVVTVGSS